MESDGRGMNDAAPDSIVSSMAKLSCHHQDEEDDTAATTTNTNTNTNTNAVSTELKNEDPLSILKMIQKLDETIAVLQQQQPPPLTSSSSTIPTSLPMEVLTHYHHIPPSVQQIYDTLLQGATLIHGTVTKYTLMGQMEQNNNNCSTAQIPYLQDLLHGCRMVTACVMTMHHPPLGCSRSVQNHTRTAVRAIVRSVVQLIQVFVVDVVDHHGNHQQHHTSLPAQRTGVVWEACTVLLEKKLPVGNRNAMRRDLFTYRMESNVTIQEFQAMLLASPSEHHHRHPTDGDNHNNEQEEEEDDDDDIEDCYSVSELPIAVACVGILKCSRGTINIAMDTMDRIGMSILPPSSSLQEDRTNTTTTGGGVTNNNNNSNNHNNNDGEDQNHARWICTSTLHDLACQVGYGVTDLGASLYPPLVLQRPDDSKKDVGALQVKDDTITTTAATATTTAVADNNDDNTLYQEVQRQSDAVRRVLQYIVDIHSKYDLSSTTTAATSSGSTDTSNTNIMDVVRNLQNAIELRTQEADGAIINALSPTIPTQQQQQLKEGI
jgi:hypothetical protein